MANIDKRATAAGENRYDVRWRLPDGQHRKKSFRRLEDARNFKRQVEHDDLAGTVIDPRRSVVTLRRYANDWLRDRRKADGSELSPRTVDLYRDLLERHILPTLGDLPLTRVRPETVRRWRAGVVDSSSTLQAAKAYRLLRTILGTAVTDERLTSNPCNIRGAGQEQSEERKAPEVETVLELADAIEPRLRALVLLAGFGTLRRGELLGLRRRDIDLLHGTVTVERQAQRLPGVGRVESDPKSRAGRRVVYLPAAVTAALEDHLTAYVAPNPNASVFVGEHGQPLSPAVLYPAFNDARRAVGCPEVTLHDLRHTAGTLAAQHGATTKELMVRMGHASPAAALRYQHASERRDADLAAEMHQTISSASGARSGAGGSNRAILAPSAKRSKRVRAR